MGETDQRNTRETVPRPVDRKMGSGERTGEEGRRSKPLATTGVHAIGAGMECGGSSPSWPVGPARAPFQLSRRVIQSSRFWSGN